MSAKQFINVAASLILALSATCATTTFAADRKAKESSVAAAAQLRTPLNLAILVQDDLVSRVGGELDTTRDFIRSLPAGSRVLVGYLTAGTLQVRQPFTDDLARAANALRVPAASESASPFNPYVEVIEALKKFDTADKNRNAILLVSDGLDVSRGFDSSSSLNSIDLQRAVREAKSRRVTVYSFYAPAVGLTSHDALASSYGQSALAQLSDETGGRAFFQGTTFVTFDAYFARLGRALGETSTAY
jgi:hypothetical protein